MGELKRSDPAYIGYDVFRAACVKEFELVLEQSGKLLRKRLAGYFASHRQADRLAFKDLFRHAAKHGLIAPAACERWLEYRDARNETERTAAAMAEAISTWFCAPRGWRRFPGKSWRG